MFPLIFLHFNSTQSIYQCFIVHRRLYKTETRRK